MFTYLGLKNFRAFESLDLELAPITILVGPNNSGKSSIISAMRILTQTVRNEDYRIPLVLNGPLGQFGTYKDLVFENVKERSIGIAIGTSATCVQTAGTIDLAEIRLSGYPTFPQP
jgi:AAA15 family ATPase/GTPase